MSLPFSIDLRPTASCNMSCPFCFGPRHNLKPMEVDKAIAIIDLISSQNTKAIVFSGGEPTLYPNLPYLLKRAKYNNLTTVVSTNGVELDSMLPEIYPFVDWLALPIDSYTKYSKNIRNISGDYIGFILRLFLKIKKDYPDIKIKIGTVVTKLNQKDVSRIPSLFNKLPKPDMWKLYQVSPSNYGKDNKKIFEIRDEDYIQIVSESRRNAHDNGILITTYMNSDRNGKYLFINPNGDSVVIFNNDEFVIGNFLDDPQSIISYWNNYVDEKKLISNFHSTYIKNKIAQQFVEHGCLIPCDFQRKDHERPIPYTHKHRRVAGAS